MRALCGGRLCPTPRCLRCSVRRALRVYRSKSMECVSSATKKCWLSALAADICTHTCVSLAHAAPFLLLRDAPSPSRGRRRAGAMFNLFCRSSGRSRLQSFTLLFLFLCAKTLLLQVDRSALQSQDSSHNCNPLFFSFLRMAAPSPRPAISTPSKRPPLGFCHALCSAAPDLFLLHSGVFQASVAARTKCRQRFHVVCVRKHRSGA